MVTPMIDQLVTAVAFRAKKVINPMGNKSINEYSEKDVGHQKRNGTDMKVTTNRSNLRKRLSNRSPFVSLLCDAIRFLLLVFMGMNYLSYSIVFCLIITELLLFSFFPSPKIDCP